MSVAWKICLGDVDMGPEDLDAVVGVLKSRWLSQGEVIQRFEGEFAARLGSKAACAVSSGTAALHLAMLAAGVGPGDEVIVPSLTFVATVNAVRYVGAAPVFADITSLDDLTISPDAIAARVTSKTKAVVVMHYGGYPVHMDPVLELAKRHGFVVIEDACHAPGASRAGRKAGTWGRLGCFSFFSTKNMTTGEGGMVVTDDPELDRRVRLMRSHGMTSLTWDRHKGQASSYDVVALGYNYRMTEFQAALGLTQLGKLEKNNARRRALTQQYRRELDGAPGIELPFSRPDDSVRSSAHLMPVLVPSPEARRHVMERLKAAGIQTSIHYPPVHRFSDFARHPQHAEGSLPVTEEAGRRILTVPMHPLLRDDDVASVTQALREAVATADARPVPVAGR